MLNGFSREASRVRNRESRRHLTHSNHREPALPLYSFVSLVVRTDVCEGRKWWSRCAAGFST